MAHHPRSIRIAVLAVFVFVVAAVSARDEIMFACVGRETSAHLTGAELTADRGFRGRVLGVRTEITYLYFEADGSARSGVDLVGRHWSPPATGNLAILYLPGEDGDSRLVGNVRWVRPTIALMFGLFAAAAILRAWRKARQYRTIDSTASSTETRRQRRRRNR